MQTYYFLSAQIQEEDEKVIHSTLRRPGCGSVFLDRLHAIVVVSPTSSEHARLVRGIRWRRRVAPQDARQDPHVPEDHHTQTRQKGQTA